jgi:hypothetical protein
MLGGGGGGRIQLRLSCLNGATALLSELVTQCDDNTTLLTQYDEKYSSMIAKRKMTNLIFQLLGLSSGLTLQFRNCFSSSDRRRLQQYIKLNPGQARTMNTMESITWAR